MNRPLLTILTLLIHLSVLGQEIVRSKDYYDLKVGVYKTKSTAIELIGLKPAVIKPQTEFTSGDKTAFLKVEDKVIALFDRINDSGTVKPIGVLTKTSVIQVDTICYKEIFKDTTKEWFLTFNVWYAISINDQLYYTDYKIHDFIGFTKKLDKFSQEFLLVSQSTGYDDYYDIGYPNFFFVAILNDKKELIYNSKILEFDYGDEFWEPEFVTTKYTDVGFEFTINGLDSKYTATWTGKELKK